MRVETTTPFIHWHCITEPVPRPLNSLHVSRWSEVVTLSRPCRANASGRMSETFPLHPLTTRCAPHQLDAIVELPFVYGQVNSLVWVRQEQLTILGLRLQRLMRLNSEAEKWHFGYQIASMKWIIFFTRQLVVIEERKCLVYGGATVGNHVKLVSWNLKDAWTTDGVREAMDVDYMYGSCDRTQQLHTSVLTRALAWFTDMSCAEHAEQGGQMRSCSQVQFYSWLSIIDAILTSSCFTITS